MMQAFEQGLDKYDISACTQAVQICIETRRCPLCDMDDGICVCAIRFADAAHPFDDEVFKRGMRVRLGSFRGVANCAKWENGRWMGMTMGCRVETRREGIGDVIEMLRRAAISDAVRPADPMDGILVLDCNSKYGRGVFESTGENAGMAESVGEWGDVCSEWVQSIHEDCGIVGSQVDAIPGEDMLFDTSIFFDMSGTEAGSVGTDGTVAGMSTMGGAEVSLTQTTIVANGGMPREAYLQTAGTSSEEGAASVSEAVRRSESDVQESEASKVRRLRAELRREKNRAAAARSNMRKKMMNDAYKAELKINKDKADMLRDKEMLLRRENMRLRKELGARDGSLGEGVV